MGVPEASMFVAILKQGEIFDDRGCQTAWSCRWKVRAFPQFDGPNSSMIRVDPYQGVLFGSVQAGAITWDKTGTTARVELKLIIRGGTQLMADINGTAVLYGTVNYGVKGTASFDGTIYFEFK
jgi:hypothetical protein